MMQQVYYQGVPMFSQEFLKHASATNVVVAQNVAQNVVAQVNQTPNNIPATGRGSFGTHGPGKKQCPNCHKVIGARTMKCECGHQFISKKQQQQMQGYVAQNVVAPVQTIQTPTIDLSKWISLGKAKLTDAWKGVGGFALSNVDTGYEIYAVLPNAIQLKKGNTVIQKAQNEVYIERLRFKPEDLARLE